MFASIPVRYCVEITLFVGLAWFGAESACLSQEPKPPADHEAQTAKAWKAFNDGDYAEAIKQADLCLGKYLKIAQKLQADLTASKGSFPEGSVSDAEKQRVFKNGILNDCGTVLYIKAQAAEKKGDRPLAAAAYKEAAALSHARCWDPNGWFWNPSQAATERLAAMKPK